MNNKITKSGNSFIKCVDDEFLKQTDKEFNKSSYELLKYAEERIDELTNVQLKDKDEEVRNLKEQYSVAKQFAPNEDSPLEERKKFYDETKSILLHINALYSEKNRIIEDRKAELVQDKNKAMAGFFGVPALLNGLKVAEIILQVISMTSSKKGTV